MAPLETVPLGPGRITRPTLDKGEGAELHVPQVTPVRAGVADLKAVVADAV